MLVLDLPGSPEGSAIRAALRAAGLRALGGVVGVEFPRGASVGVLLEGQEVRLVDERDTTLLRIERRGLAPEWLEAAVRLHGTMLTVTTGLGIEVLDAAPELAAALEVEGREGRLDGAIIGVSDRRPRLPLLF